MGRHTSAPARGGAPSTAASRPADRRQARRIAPACGGNVAAAARNSVRTRRRSTSSRYRSGADDGDDSARTHAGQGATEWVWEWVWVWQPGQRAEQRLTSWSLCAADSVTADGWSPPVRWAADGRHHKPSRERHRGRECGLLAASTTGMIGSDGPRGEAGLRHPVDQRSEAIRQCRPSVDRTTRTAGARPPRRPRGCGREDVRAARLTRRSTMSGRRPRIRRGIPMSLTACRPARPFPPRRRAIPSVARSRAEDGVRSSRMRRALWRRQSVTIGRGGDITIHGEDGIGDDDGGMGRRRRQQLSQWSMSLWR